MNIYVRNKWNPVRLNLTKLLIEVQLGQIENTTRLLKYTIKKNNRAAWDELFVFKAKLKKGNVIDNNETNQQMHTPY